MTDPVLVADIGGTNARFGMAARSGGAWAIAHYAKFPGDDYGTFESVLKTYLDQSGARPGRAIFSVAGPVAGGKARLTNRNWSLDAAHLSEVYEFKQCLIVNDFAAMTRSIPELSEDDFLTLKKGEAHPDAPVLVAGPGTGFGAGYLVPLRSSMRAPIRSPIGSGGWQVLTTEAGHQAYAPQTDRELALLKILRAEFGFVTLEKVCSGSGLDDVHRAICRRRGQAYQALAPDVIREMARNGDPLCLEICEIRAAAVMGAVGDMALSGGARGGVVLAGGVSERMIDFFKAEAALSRFTNRGKRSDYMAEIPIRVMTNPKAALYGAAALFEDLAE